jgi:uncharacterized membrane protein YedE/YeeE
MPSVDLVLPSPAQARSGSSLAPGGRPFAIAAAAIVLGSAYLAAAIDWRQAALFLVGGGAGLILYHAAFGFTSAWRVFISDRRGAGLRAQMLMLAAASIVFFPVLGSGHIFGHAARGSVAPLSLGLLAGAFMFGLGMQLGGGCASGTLYTSGGGNPRMFVTLFFFIVGSVVGALHQPMWQRSPALPGVSLVEHFGPYAALAMCLALCGAIAWVTLAIERRHHRSVEPIASAAFGTHPGGWLRGPWPLAAGALGLAAVNIFTLAIAGRPWGVTSAFALWGSKALALGGVHVEAWPYWASRTADLQASVLADPTSVMDIGIMLGALMAAGLAGKFLPIWRVPPRSLVAAAIGGVLLGYGARIAYGCNIGAYFGGIISSSLHGWVWGVAAFAGSIAGTWLRPWFGLRVECTPRDSC